MKKNIFNVINRHITLPLSDLYTHQNISKTLDFLLESQWWSEEKLKEYQNEKLRGLVKYAYENVPYYTEIFNERSLSPKNIQTSDDLQKLPILTKDIIRENFANKKIIAKNYPKKLIIPSQSSGSTAEPLKFYNTKEAWGFNLACAIRAWYWSGYQLGDKYMKVSQHERAPFKKVQDFLNRCRYLPAEHLTDEYFKVIVDEIKAYDPLIVRGYVDQLLFLANYVHQNKIVIEKPFTVMTTGSTLHMSRRNIIKEYLGCNVYDSYRCEGGANVSECKNNDAYHSSMEYAITEIISEGKEVGHGEQGRLITTDLLNYAVPFIRYDTQDIVTKGRKGKCECGRELLQIKKIHGRDSDFLITPSGKYLIFSVFDTWFPALDSVKQFQIIQEELDYIVMKLVVNEKFYKSEHEKVFNFWSTYIGNDVKFELQIVKNIPLTKSGKRRYLIRSKNIKLPF